MPGYLANTAAAADLQHDLTNIDLDQVKWEGKERDLTNIHKEGQPPNDMTNIDLNQVK